MGNSNSNNVNLSQNYLLGNGTMTGGGPTKKTGMAASNNPLFSFLPPSNNPTKYSHLSSNASSSSMGGPGISNPLQRAPMMSSYIATSNGASPPPPPPPHILNGNEIDPNFPPINVSCPFRARIFFFSPRPFLFSVNRSVRYDVIPSNDRSDAKRFE